jgi:hypothetical protein
MERDVNKPNARACREGGKGARGPNVRQRYCKLANSIA